MCWIVIMDSFVWPCSLAVFRLDMTLCLGHLPKLFSVAMTCLLSHHKIIRCAGEKVINVSICVCHWGGGGMYHHVCVCVTL